VMASSGRRGFAGIRGDAAVVLESLDNAERAHLNSMAGLVLEDDLPGRARGMTVLPRTG